MDTPVTVLVAGATSHIGESVVNLLAERRVPLGQLLLVDSTDKAGSRQSFGDKYLLVRDQADADLAAVSLAILACGSSSAAEIRQRLPSDAFVVDLSGADGATHLAVPEINGDQYASGGRYWVSPHPLSIALAVPLHALQSQLTVQGVSVHALLPVSLKGRKGVKTLAEQCARLLNGQSIAGKGGFPSQIAFNAIADVTGVDEARYSALERRVAGQLAALLQLDESVISVSVTYVPVFFGVSAQVSLAVAENAGLEQAADCLRREAGIRYWESGSPDAISHVIDQDEIHIARLREDNSYQKGLNFWVVSDNVRKGAALNSVEIAEILLRDRL